MCVIFLYICVCENILFAFQSPTYLFKVLPFAPRTRASSVRVRTSLLRKTLRLLLLLLPGPESPRDFNLSSGDDEPVCRFSRSTVFDFFLLHERLRASDWLAFTADLPPWMITLSSPFCHTALPVCVARTRAVTFRQEFRQRQLCQFWRGAHKHTRECQNLANCWSFPIARALAPISP